jgi:hypothetical protein
MLIRVMPDHLTPPASLAGFFYKFMIAWSRFIRYKVFRLYLVSSRKLFIALSPQGTGSFAWFLT